MALSHRLQRLEKRAPPPPRPCEYCGIAFLRDGSGPVWPGVVLTARPEHDEPCMMGCKTCGAWVKIDCIPECDQDGAYRVTNAITCGWPDYI